MGTLVLLLLTPPVPPPNFSELPVPPLVADPLALLPVAVAGALLPVRASTEPPVLPPVAVTGASLLLYFPLIVDVEPLLLMPVAGPQFLLL